MKTMGNPIFRVIRVRGHSLVDVLCLRIIARISATVVDMHVSLHRSAYEVAQQRVAIVF